MTITLKRFTDYQNAGDVASAVVVRHLLGRDIRVIPLQAQTGPHLLAIGSILEWAGAESVVWGSGFIRTGSRPAGVPRAILAVRGALTLSQLAEGGIRCDPVLGDPGVFIPHIYPWHGTRRSFGLVPHYVDWDLPFVASARAQGVRVIDPLSPLPAFVAELAQCERILSSSLHGLIFAHAYGIPAAWIHLSDRVMGDGFKFRDYYSAVGVPARDVPVLGADRNVARLFDACHLPPSGIDKATLRAALTEAVARLAD
jgi:pyruvyltransferase